MSEPRSDINQLLMQFK